MTPERQKIIEELTRIMEERSASHGSATSNFGALSEVWTWWLENRGISKIGHCLSPEDAAAMCMLAKVARLVSAGGRGNIDNWIDAAGYAICGGEVAEIRKAADEAEKA